MWPFDNFNKKMQERIVFKDGVTVTSKDQPSFSESGIQGINNNVNWGKLLGLGNYNPDDIGISTYKEMLKDSEVKTGFDFVRNAILARDWKVTFPEIGSNNDKNNTEILEFLRYAFGNLEENAQFEKSVGNLLYAIPFGFSVLEIVYKVIEEGSFSGKIGIKKLKDLDPETINFVTDKYGNLEKIIQNAPAAGIEVDIPLDRAIIYTPEKEFGNYYGVSRFKSIYKNWFIKKTVIKFWNIALERFGMPILMGTVPNKADLKRMSDLLDNVQTRSSIAKTAGWEISTLETGVGRSAGGDYAAAIKYHDEQILKGMLVPPMLIAGAGGGGSYALSNTQFGLFQTMLKSIETDLSDIIEEKIIKPLVIYNYGVQDIYPQFIWEPMTKEDLLNLSKVFAILVKNGIVGADEQWVRDAMGIPHRDASEITKNTIIDESNNKTGNMQTTVKVSKTASQQVKTPKSIVPGRKVGLKGGDKSPI